LFFSIAKKFIGVLLYVIVNSIAFGDSLSIDIDNNDINQRNSYVSQNTLLPNIGSSPNTGFLLGVFVNRRFKFSKKIELTRPSNINVSITYTEKKQFIFKIRNQIFSPEEKWRWDGKIEGKQFPEVFYGIGNNTTEKDTSNIFWNRYDFDQRLLKKFSRNNFVGGQIKFQKLTDFEHISGKNYNIIKGFNNNSLIYGTGLTYVFDTRDDVYTSKKGIYLEIKSDIYHGDYSFKTFNTDLRKFINKNNLVFAWQGKINFLSGAAPFWELPMLGSEEIMRGFYEGRYRDNNAVASQFEIRHKILSRIGYVLFFGLGQVSNNITEFNLSEMHSNYGFGFRFQLNKNDPTNIRFDIGLFSGGGGLLIKFREAF
tara:strand:- start:156 stop:1262 length:1107 start_codon:yes stop_codon:yes gene_type:complete